MNESGRPRRMILRRMAATVLAIYWIALFIGTHIPLPPNAFPPGVSDKSLHFASYGGLAFLLALWRSFSGAGRRSDFIKWFVLIAGYGILDELLQIPVNRHADVHDWLADVIGAAIGLTAFAFAARFARTGQRTPEASDASPP